MFYKVNFIDSNCIKLHLLEFAWKLCVLY